MVLRGIWIPLWRQSAYSRISQTPGATNEKTRKEIVKWGWNKTQVFDIIDELPNGGK
jgi:hypothetical protein